MEITFATKRLRVLCEEPSSAGSLAVDVVEALQRRMSDLRAAGSVEELTQVSEIKLTDGKNPALTYKLSKSVELVCEVAHHTLPRDEDGGLRWDRVRRVKVTYVGEAR